MIRTMRSMLASLLLLAAAGCSGNDGNSVPPGPPPDLLFTSAAVPRCDGSTLLKITGQLSGQTINVATFLLSNLDPNGFQILEVVGGNVRTDLALTWSDPLAENKALPLTGAGIRIPEGQPLGGMSFCITAGKFGSPTPTANDGGGRQLLFQITGVRENDCNGASVPVSLSGCDWRSTTYFPIPTPADGG
jgi:hypothetical protein